MVLYITAPGQNKDTEGMAHVLCADALYFYSYNWEH